MIMQVPETLLGTAIATALLPSLAEFAAKKEWDTFSSTVEKALRVMLALSLPAAAVIAAGLAPLLKLAFRFDYGTELLTLTSRVYLLTLAGYVAQETLARVFYARKEPLIPLFGVMLRIFVYVVIGVVGVTILRQAGAPAIAAAELSISVEALFLLVVLNRRVERKVRVLPAIGKGLLASLACGAVTYALALYLPGPGYLTALAGMLVGTLLALGLVWSEARLLFRL